MTDWIRYDFEPLDVFMNADARPLDEGAYGHEGDTSPIAFAGALRTAVLRHAGYAFGKPADRQSEAAGRAGEIVGYGRDGGFSFALAGPFYRHVNGVVLVPPPRDQMQESETSLVATAPLRPAPGTYLSDAGAHGVDILSSPAPWGAAPQAGWMTVAHVCAVLGDAARECPSLDARWRTFASRVRPGNPVIPDTLAATERRHGHARSGRGVVEEGRLYSRSATRFVEQPSAAATDRPVSSGAFSAFVRGVPAEFLPASDTLVRLGGDGHQARLVRHDDPVELGAIADLSPIVHECIVETGRFSLYLATPAIFADGWRPSLARIGLDSQARLVAAAVSSHRIVAGWDLVANQPKPVSRAVPAGAVYFFEAAAQADRHALADGVTKQLAFNRSISDRYGLLGFGLTLVGVW